MAKKATTPTKALFPNDTPLDKKTQKEIVYEILNSGLLKPAEIEKVAVEKYQETISKGNINQIKMKWKAENPTAAMDAARKAIKSPTNTSPSAAYEQFAAPKAPTELPQTDPGKYGDVALAVLHAVKTLGLEQAEALINALRPKS